jgi:hypothetical protein
MVGLRFRFGCLRVDESRKRMLDWDCYQEREDCFERPASAATNSGSKA